MKLPIVQATSAEARSVMAMEVVLERPPVPEAEAVVGGQNHKLAKSSIVTCAELEGNGEACKWFEVDGKKTPYCVGCYAYTLFPVRSANSSGRATTPESGIIRLGTWKEVTAEDYAAFTAGRGRRPNGDEWVRPDFQERKHFVISRGLEAMSLYNAMVGNPNLLNLQVSVDILRTPGQAALQVPSDERLRELVKLDKVVLRFKTIRAAKEYKGKVYDANTADFHALQQRLGINPMRILETPLRLGNHVYQQETPLEEFGWDSKAFLRCNSECNACPSSTKAPGENRVLGCAVTPAILRMLEKVGNVEPARIKKEAPPRFEWTKLTVEAWKALGGTATLQDLYKKVTELEPRVAENNYFRTKVRAAVQRLGTQVARATWKLKEDTE